MSNYTKLTDFASKDTLPSGNAAKILKGTEIDDEFEAIEAAIETKADISYVDAINLSVVWPVGSVYINASSSSNPSTLLGFGTWVEIGAGKVLVGQDAADTSFDTLGATGGSKDAIVVEHTHTASTSTAGEHTHSVTNAGRDGSLGGYFDKASSTGENIGSDAMEPAGEHTHDITVDSTGQSGTNANLQPYVVVKMWQRTA
jgi:hypothetical protein